MILGKLYLPLSLKGDERNIDSHKKGEVSENY
jgi:hypothetical protein